MTSEAITAMAPRIGTRAACRAAGVAQASWYRRHRVSPAPARRAPVPHRDRAQPRALAPAERQAIMNALHSPRFADLAPGEVWAILLDEGVYLGSQSTFYRLLRRAGETRERRRQATHPSAMKPELLATGPNQVWSWDITKLHGPAKWTYYCLYVILDIHSRYVTGWMLAARESAVLAESSSPPPAPNRASVVVIQRLGATCRDDGPDLPCHGSGHRLTLGMCEPYAQVSRSLVRRLWSPHGVMPSPKIGT